MFVWQLKALLFMCMLNLRYYVQTDSAQFKSRILESYYIIKRVIETIFNFPGGVKNWLAPLKKGEKYSNARGDVACWSFHLTDTQYMYINYVTSVSLNKNRGNRYKTKRKKMVSKIKEARKFKQIYLQLTDGELKRTVNSCEQRQREP